MENYAIPMTRNLGTPTWLSIMTKLTESSFKAEDSLELDLQKMLASILGINVGKYQYKEVRQ